MGSEIDLWYASRFYVICSDMVVHSETNLGGGCEALGSALKLRMNPGLKDKETHDDMNLLVANSYILPLLDKPYGTA